MNAIRLSAFRRLLSPTDAAAILADFEADIADGGIVIAKCNLAEVMTEAKRLSATYSLIGGHRAFDILHVATALYLEAAEFLSFDENQNTLAKAAGLKVR